jgi:hypothetical protein
VSKQHFQPKHEAFAMTERIEKRERERVDEPEVGTAIAEEAKGGIPQEKLTVDQCQHVGKKNAHRSVRTHHKGRSKSTFSGTIVGHQFLVSDRPMAPTKADF